MNLIHTFEAVQEASRQLLELTDKDINKILHAVADAAIEQTDFILSENLKDLERMDPANPKYDRLKLTKERLQSIAFDIRNVATLPSPLGRTLKYKQKSDELKKTPLLYQQLNQTALKQFGYFSLIIHEFIINSGNLNHLWSIFK